MGRYIISVLARAYGIRYIIIVLFFTVLAPVTAGGSLFFSGIGSAIVLGSSVASLVDSGNNDGFIIDAQKNSDYIKKDVGFLEELMTIYMASRNEAVPTLTFEQKMIRYLSSILETI